MLNTLGEKVGIGINIWIMPNPLLTTQQAVNNFTHLFIR